MKVIQQYLFNRSKKIKKDNMTYDVFYFLSKFEKISEDKWFVGNYGNGEGAFCAMGHCDMTIDKFLCQAPEAEALYNLFFGYDLNVPVINDGKDDRFQQSTAKQRIIAALNFIKAKQYPEEKPLLSTTQQFKEITFEKIKEEIKVPQSVN